MGYKGTLQIEENVLRVLKNHPKVSAEKIAQILNTSENHVIQGISHLRKNVLKPNEAIVTHYRKRMTTNKPCEYELIVQSTSRADGIQKSNKVTNTLVRHLREISKLNLVLLATTNPDQITAIRLEIANVMTKISREMNLANLGMLPATNRV